MNSYFELTALSLVGYSHFFIEAKVSPQVKAKEVFHLEVSPRQVAIGTKKKPIELTFTNVTNKPQKIRIMGWPVSLDGIPDKKPLKLLWINAVTGQEAPFTYSPAVNTSMDVHGKEFTEEVPSHKSFILYLDLQDWSKLRPGQYIARFQYDTRFLPSWIKPDTHAWHGATNIVGVRVEVQNVPHLATGPGELPDTENPRTGNLRGK